MLKFECQREKHRGWNLQDHDHCQEGSNISILEGAENNKTWEWWNCFEKRTWPIGVHNTKIFVCIDEQNLFYYTFPFMCHLMYEKKKNP